MSRGGRAESIAHLRRAVEAIEARSGTAEPRPGARLSLGRALDRRLFGGLALDALHEIAPAAPADGPAATGFALSLAARCLAERRSAGMIVVEDFAERDMGALYGPGLVSHGLDLARLVFVKTPDAPSLFQAMEDALRSGAPAFVLGEVWRLKGYDLNVSRRLLLAARAGMTPGLLVQASAYGAADRISSAAETRFEIAAAPSAHEPSAAGARGLPGRPSFSARIVKARIAHGRGPPAELDTARIIRLVWRSEDRTFDEPAIPLPLAAAADDGPRAARASS
jgi:protein ImuA